MSHGLTKSPRSTTPPTAEHEGSNCPHVSITRRRPRRRRRGQYCTLSDQENQDQPANSSCTEEQPLDYRQKQGPNRLTAVLQEKDTERHPVDGCEPVVEESYANRQLYYQHTATVKDQETKQCMGGPAIVRPVQQEGTEQQRADGQALVLEEGDRENIAYQQTLFVENSNREQGAVVKGKHTEQQRLYEDTFVAEKGIMKQFNYRDSAIVETRDASLRVRQTGPANERGSDRLTVGHPAVVEELGTKHQLANEYSAVVQKCCTEYQLAVGHSTIVEESGSSQRVADGHQLVVEESGTKQLADGNQAVVDGDRNVENIDLDFYASLAGKCNLIPDETLMYFSGPPKRKDALFFKHLHAVLKAAQAVGLIDRLDIESPKESGSSTSEGPLFSESQFLFLESPHAVTEERLEDETALCASPRATLCDSPNSDSFCSLSSTNVSLSSFELINHQGQSWTASEGVEQCEEKNRPLCPQDLLMPYVDDRKEEMLVSLVQDFTQSSLTVSWSPEKEEGSYLRDGQSLANDLSPVVTDFSENTQRGCSQTTEDVVNADSPEPLSQDANLIGCSYEHNRKYSDLEIGVPSDALRYDVGNPPHTKHQEPLTSDGGSINEDAHIRANAEKEFQNLNRQQKGKKNKPKKPGVHRPRYNWWSAAENKKDISFLRIPSVAFQNLVFHLDHNDGALKIGEGSFGSVFLADLYMYGSVYPVVVKDFTPKGITKPFEILEEARILTHLMDTDFIPYFYGVLHIASPQRFALVQEFYGQGLSLQNLLDDKTHCLSLTIWANLCIQMTEGLLRFHLKGVLLNDIKKDNILVDSRNGHYILKFIDMGLATYKSGRVFFGSQDYMQQFTHLAPEVRQLQPTSPAADVYSLAKILMSISRNVPFCAIKNLALPCLNQFPEKRPSIGVLVCLLHQVREKLNIDPFDDSPPELPCDYGWSA